MKNEPDSKGPSHPINLEGMTASQWKETKGKIIQEFEDKVVLLKEIYEKHPEKYGNPFPSPEAQALEDVSKKYFHD